jgi:hypothetical protein
MYISLSYFAGILAALDSAFNKNEYQESSWGRKRPARTADNLAVIYEPNV